MAARKISKEELRKRAELFWADYSKGLSCEDVGKIHNYSWITVYNTLKACGYQIRNKHGRKSKMVRRVDNGQRFKNVKVAAKTVGRKPASVYSAIRKGHYCNGFLFEWAE